MVIDWLLISEGSWLVPLTAENATLAPAARTDIPKDDVTPPSAEGFESHTTKHFPSKTTGSVSFCPKERPTPHPRRMEDANHNGNNSVSWPFIMEKKKLPAQNV